VGAFSVDTNIGDNGGKPNAYIIGSKAAWR